MQMYNSLILHFGTIYCDIYTNNKFNPLCNIKLLRFILKYNIHHIYIINSNIMI